MILALDFDGVISDSAPESFAVARATWASLWPDSRLAAAQPVPEELPAPEAVAAHPLYPPFLELMPLGNRAEDFGVALAILEAGAEVADQREYDAFRGTLGEAWLEAFHARFYELRAAHAQRDPGRWRRLMGPYADFLEVLRRRAADATLAVVTAKDRRTVELLLRDYGIDDLFDGERLLDKETGVSKTAHLARLKRSLGAPYSEITFVDDKVNHLDSVAHLGVRCALAAWGYNGRREVRQARERGYLVCALHDAEAQLFCA